MSFPTLLMNRELGQPKAQLKIMEAIDQKMATNLVRDCFDFATIELSQSSHHYTFRCRDFVAVLSINKTGQKARRVALWSLCTRGKLWDVEITQNYEGSSIGSCIMSECGMILVDSPTMGCKIIVLDGKLSGELPKLNWYSILPMGQRILSCWAEHHNPDNQRAGRLPENSSHFFGEWDYEGKSLSRYQLDYIRGGWTHAYACNENFWVRLSGSNQADLGSLIEVFDRVIGTMKKFELPLNSEEEKFSSACIVQNRLFYGKNLIRPLGQYNMKVICEPTIYIYDLVRGAILEEFPTGDEAGEPIQLVANQYYAAWLVNRGSNNDCVQYLDILKKTIKKATSAPYCANCPKVVLDILGTVLSVTYAEGYWHTGSSRWRRQVIDMTNGELKCDVRYKRFPWGECSISNGNMLITDYFSTPSRMYVESFVGQGLSTQSRDIF